MMKMTDSYQYKLLLTVIINALIFILFALGFLHSKKREWRSFGIFSAFVVALFLKCMAFL